MLTTNCAFLENELMDAVRIFQKRPDAISHAFSYADGVFYNTFLVDGQEFSFEDRGRYRTK